MVRPWKDPWGLSPSLRPLETLAVLMDCYGHSQPVGPPRSSCDAYVGRVCHCHCVVTVAPGTRCAWYRSTTPSDADQLPPGPGIRYIICYQPLRPFTGHTGHFLGNFIDFWRFITIYGGSWSHVDILTQAYS